MTPNDLEILIHCNVCPEPHPRLHALAVEESIRNFIRDGILEVGEKENTFKTTEKGRAWLQMILKTPYPALVWVDEDGWKIEY